MFLGIISQVKQPREKSRQVIPTGLRILAIVLLILGIFFRFTNLDRKVYWHDETFTSLRISGYTTKEVRQQLFDGRVIHREDLQKYQRPNSEKSLGDTMNSLIKEDPQHPPLYYAIAWAWVQIFGYSVATIRSLSAVISLLVFPSMYWLCWELFGTSLVGWVAIALVAVSPFQLIYAQEAREYILWAVTILVSSAALLRAMRLKTKQSWGIYAVTLALGFYTFLLTGLVAVGHGIYVLAMERFRFTQTAIAYLLASLAGILAFAPWIFILIINFSIFQQTTGWLATINLSLSSLIKTWLFYVSLIYIDLDLVIYSKQKLAFLLLTSALILLAALIYFTWGKLTQKSRFFLWALIGTTASPLMVLDVVFGGVRSATHRYLIPSFLGIQIAIAYLLTNQILDARFFKRQIWKTIMAVIISVGVLSYTFSSQAETWQNKFMSYNLPKIARLINQTTHPILIGDLSDGNNIGHLFSLSYLVEPKVEFRLFTKPNISKIPVRVGDVFLFNPSETLRLTIEQQSKSKAKRIFRDQYLNLWKLSEPKS